MTSTTALSLIKEQQQHWAAARGISFDTDGYCLVRDDNLFAPLSSAAVGEFGDGAGGELSDAGGRAKIRALHSSASLACNFFEYWRSRDTGPIATALGLDSPPGALSYERTFPTGLAGTAPHLDVVLDLGDRGILAIESKFTEPYTERKKKDPFRPSYFPAGRQLWNEAGLPGCQSLAEKLHAGTIAFAALDAAQLLKHMLGLGQRESPWRLCCLWHDAASERADQHRHDLQAFSKELGPDASRFDSMTYQEAFRRMQPVLSPGDTAWSNYFLERYCR